MEINEFKDRLFNALNETDALPIADIVVDDRNDRMRVLLADHTSFTVTCTDAGTWFLQLPKKSVMKVGIVMKKKIAAMVVIVTMLSIYIGYLQFGREMDVVNSFSFSSDNFLEESIKVSLNTIFVTDKKEDIAENIIQCVLDNSFHTIRFNFDRGYPNRLNVDVYKSKKDIQSGDMIFSFTYWQGDDGKIGAYDISQAEHMKLEIDSR